jgi:hypothetical protein
MRIEHQEDLVVHMGSNWCWLKQKFIVVTCQISLRSIYTRRTEISIRCSKMIGSINLEV